MLPVTTALAAGILLASWRMPTVWIAAAGVAACSAAAAAALIQGRYGGAKGSVRSGRTTATVAVLLAGLFLGEALAALQLRVDTPGDGVALYEVAITGDAYLRAGDKTLRGDGRLIAGRDESGSWHRLRGRLRIYADTAMSLTAGQHVVCRGRVRPFGDDGYSMMMRRKGYAGQLYISSSNTLKISDNRTSSLRHGLHRRAVARIGRLPLKPDNMTVAQAVGTGESSMLSRSLRSDYSRAGIAHLLALSGLHVGIIFVIINLLLRWLPLISFGHIMRSAAAVALLWLYVLATGMPPSAVRAALMFSMLQIAQAASADYSPLNALCAAAFISLCADTSLLFDAGFRLSYIAVAAIIVCALPLLRRTRIHCDQRRGAVAKCSAAALNFVTATIITGFAATVATAPLVSHLFGVIPLAGIVTGPAAIAAAAATVFLTAVWIAVPADFAAPLFGRAVDFTVGAMNSLSERLAGYGAAAIETRLSATEVAICYTVMAAVVCIVATIRSRKRKTPKFPIE